MARDNDINININGKYRAKSAIKQAENDINNLGKKADATDKKMKQASKSTNGFGSSSSKTSNKFKQLGSSIGVFNKGLGNSVTKLGATQGALAGLTGLLGGALVAGIAVAAAALGAFGVMSYNKAKESQAEWAKFKGVVESAGQSFENSKSVVSSYASTSGRAVADVRGAFQQLTAAGIDPSNKALRAVNELAIGLKSNMADASTAYTRIMKGGAGAGRTLAKLGLTMEDISTGGKVDTEKLNRILEEKFGKAADEYAKTNKAAMQRLTDTWTRLQVRFGNLLLGPATDLANALSWAMDALIKWGEILWGLFGGADAFKYAMEYITPAIDELWKTIKEIIDPITGVGDQSGSLQFLLTDFGWVISMGIRGLTLLIKGAKWAYDMTVKFGQAVWLAGDWLVKMGRKVWAAGVQAYSTIVNASNTLRSWLVSAGQKIWQAAVNFPGWIYDTIVNAIPKIQWPSLGQISQWIRDMIWGSRGPGLGNISGQIAQQSALRASNLAAQRQKLQTTYNSSPAAQSAASQANANMGIFGIGRGPGDSWMSAVSGIKYNYQDYAGSRQKAWNGGDCMTGNCVDMSLGVLNVAAANGARGGNLRFGTWNGGPHVWAEVDGVTVDPARKALNGTFAAPARGPGDGSRPIVIDMRGSTIYDGPKFEKAITNILNKHLG